jgi:molybdopterin converting factor small subunit
MITVTVKGETEFGLPKDYEEVELSEPTFASIMEHYNVNPKVRTYLYPVVNNQLSKPDRRLHDGDTIILQSPYAGG